MDIDCLLQFVPKNKFCNWYYIMRTFRDKYFRNNMHPLDAYYECILSCEINTNSESWQGIDEDCETKCIKQHLKAIFM